jgi:hypothetical protein
MRRCLIGVLAVALMVTAATCAQGDEIKVSTDGTNARRVTVRVENGQRSLFGRFFQRGAARRGSVTPPEPKVIVIPQSGEPATRPAVILIQK